MARSMRKRHREKQRRSDVNSQFTSLIELLRKIQTEYDSDCDDDDESDDDSVVTPPTKRITTKQVFASHRTTSTDEKN